MTVGLEFLKKHPRCLSKLQQNLQRNVCVTCGKIPLSKCDKQFGMCNDCHVEITQTHSQFDKLWFSQQEGLLNARRSTTQFN